MTILLQTLNVFIIFFTLKILCKINYKIYSVRYLQELKLEFKIKYFKLNISCLDSVHIMYYFFFRLLGSSVLNGECLSDTVSIYEK